MFAPVGGPTFATTALDPLCALGVQSAKADTYAITVSELGAGSIIAYRLILETDDLATVRGAPGPDPATFAPSDLTRAELSRFVDAMYAQPVSVFDDDAFDADGDLTFHALVFEFRQAGAAVSFAIFTHNPGEILPWPTPSGLRGLNVPLRPQIQSLSC